MNKISKIYKCDCFTESLQFDIDYEEPFNYEPSVNICMWNIGKYGTGNVGLKERLRWCKQILKTGNMWSDEIILDLSTAEQFAIDLLDAIKIARKDFEDKLNQSS